MENGKTPSRDDLHAYQVLINFLTQVRTLLRDNYIETEHSIELLKELKTIIEEQDYALQGLTSTLEDYEEAAERILRPKGMVPAP
jgi:argininosuccinate lyase